MPTTPTGDANADEGKNRPIPDLVRGIGLQEAVALNMLDMIGVGPFITLPLIITAMGGPQALVGWALGAVLAICDGLVWAELGAAMPKAGGSYEFLRTIYGHRAGRFVAFIYVWQLALSAPLSIASGCIGLAEYAGYIVPGLHRPVFLFGFHFAGAGLFHLNYGVLLAIACCWLAVFLLYRSIQRAGRISIFLWLGVMAVLLWVIAAGAMHFHASLAFSFPAGAFQPSKNFFLGLGAASLIATYDFWGYYNVCFLGGEVRNPRRNIPRAVILSILLVAALYIALNLSVLGVLPWREIVSGKVANIRTSIVAVFMERIYGTGMGRTVAALVMWTAFASVFSLLLGYSRVFYAAARDGNFFAPFARLHSKHRIPHVAILWLAIAASFLCGFRLLDVIAALVVLRLVMQFLLQQVGLLSLRHRKPEMFASFKMRLYPLPVFIAIAGSIFMLLSRHHSSWQMILAFIVAGSGALVYWLRRPSTATRPPETGSGEIV